MVEGYVGVSLDGVEEVVGIVWVIGGVVGSVFVVDGGILEICFDVGYEYVELIVVVVLCVVYEVVMLLAGNVVEGWIIEVVVVYVLGVVGV